MGIKGKWSKWYNLIYEHLGDISKTKSTTACYKANRFKC